MGVLVDTSVWSQFLRRRRGKGDVAIRSSLAELIEGQQVRIIGPVRQELLSGIREAADFETLRERLRAFPDHTIATEDYETAAEFFNVCRAGGIQGSFIDFLICAVAGRAGFRIYTLDKDFGRYAKLLPIRLYAAGR